MSIKRRQQNPKQWDNGLEIDEKHDRLDTKPGDRTTQHNPGHNKMVMTHSQIESVLADVAAGVGLRKAAATADLSSPARWIEAVQADGALAERYARARVIGLQMIADDIQGIADDRESDPDANSRRLRVDSRKWLLSKLVPKQYGDKIQLDHSGSVSQVLTDAELTAIALQGKPTPDR